MDAQQLTEAIKQATAVTHDPTATAQRRAEAVQFFEQLKHGEIHSTVHAAAMLTDTQYALEVQMSAYTLLQILVRNRWTELSAEEQQKITQLAYQHMKDVGHLGQQAAWPLKSKAALLLAAVTRQQGPETYSALLPQLVSSAAEGPMQAEISCMVLQFVSEDITQFEDRGGDWKRNYLSALSASVDTVLPFLVKLLQESFQAGSSAAGSQQMQAAAAHAAVVAAALGTLTAFVEWAPLTRLVNSGVIEACGFFLGVPDFRADAFGVVKQELDLEGANEETGRQLCALMTTMADMHWAHVDSVQKQHQILKYMLEFLRHPHLPLAAAALTFWSTLVREAGGGWHSRASPLASPRDSMSADGGPQQQQQQQSSQPGSQQQQQQQPSSQPGSQQQQQQQQQPNNPASIPQLACQLLVEILSEQLVRLPVRFENVEVPLWAESAEDYKSSVVQFRSQAKLVMRAAAKLAPQEVLNSVGPLQQTCLSLANTGNAAAAAAAAGGSRTAAAQQQLSRGHMALETAVVLLESVLPSLLDPSVLAGQAPAFKDSMVGLLQPLLALRYTDPVMVALHARALEAFARLMPQAPEQLVPLISTSFECMAAIPLEQNGQLPPPAKVTWRWKEEAMARISMAKVLLNVAKEAPGCFLQHLQSLVQQVAQLWAAGQLREGEKAQLSPLQPAFRMDPVERALRSGGVREEAKKLEEDGGTIAGANLPALRHWLKSIRESTYLTVQFAAAHLGPAFWRHEQLASIIPQALTSNLDVMEDRHLKLLFRHVLTSFLASCPASVRPPWLAPIFSRLMPYMHTRLVAKWAQVQASASGSGSGTAAANGSSQQQQQLSEEVVGETLLREMTREYMVLLTKATERGLPAATGNGGGSSANGATAAVAAAAAAAAIAGPPRPAAAAAAAEEQLSVLESLWQPEYLNVTGPAIQALVATAVAAMCWPDSHAAGKATRICMFIASLAEMPAHAALEAQVLPDMLRSAMLSVVQVSSITIQADVLQLLRQILVTWLPRSEAIRGVLLQLPHITPEGLASFQQQLASLNSEKDQRGLIKTLLAETGGEAARAVLSAVSKVGVVPVTNLGESKAAKQQQQQQAVDELRWDWSEAGISL